MIPVWTELLLERESNFGAKTQAIPDASCCFAFTGRMYGRSKSRGVIGQRSGRRGTAAIPHPLHFQMISTQVNLGPFFPR